MERIRDVVIIGLFFLFIGSMAVMFRADEKVAALALEPHLSEELVGNLPFKDALVEISGSFMKTAGVRSYYRSSGINITGDGYVVGRYAWTSTDYEVAQMKGFKDYLDSKGIRLLYVSEPAKYIDDEFYTKEFGGESYLNRNTDLFLERIGKEGIGYIDLRDNIREEGLDSLRLFYRTDHHWTVPASKWAAKMIAGKLNDDYGYDIDLSLYDDERFHTVEYKNAWLGEQGKKVALSYIGLDDYTMVEPLYPTSYSIYPLGQSGQGEPAAEGDFDIFVKKTVYDTEADPYTAPSWHYAYQGAGYKNKYSIRNNNIDGGNVLLIGDSYEASMLPFLSLGIGEITHVVLRDFPEGESIRAFVEQGNYDTVIIAYAQFMIGAHDNEGGANYRMFMLE